jgi:hypothetical protein
MSRNSTIESFDATVLLRDTLATAERVISFPVREIKPTTLILNALDIQGARSRVCVFYTSIKKTLAFFCHKVIVYSYATLP